MPKPLAFVIEDDPALSEIFSIALQDDFETRTIVDGDAALAQLAQTVPAVIVLDLHLPNISGADVFAKIRADKRFANTRVILSTADAVQAEVLREQADFVLLKPVNPLQLRDLASRLR